MKSAGRILILSKGDWVSGTAYVPLDSVYYEGCTYLCKKAITESTTAPDTDTEHWQIESKGFDEHFITTSITEDVKKVPNDKSVYDAVESLKTADTTLQGNIDAAQSAADAAQSAADAAQSAVDNLFEVVHTW